VFQVYHILTPELVKQISDLKGMPGFDRIPPHPKVVEAIARSQARIDRLVQQPLLYTGVALEGRSDVIRSQESNLGNMLADALRAFYDTDIAFVNSGGIRCDRVIESSERVPMRVRDLVDIIPFNNPLVVKRISGRNLAAALENSVSDAHTDGRFLCLSGLRTLVHWICPEGQRIKDIHFLPGNGRGVESLDRNRFYTVAMSSFISSGFDGYTCLTDAEIIVDVEGAMTDTDLMLQVFKGALKPGETNAREVADKTTAGLARAREAVIKRWHEGDRLPIVGPVLDRRVRAVKNTCL
jgi:2',3'-cyclic-nucleotide 2'-phosphodiesterase (5'-nucleotidase family)